jgi:hypothetical protein
MHTLSLMIPRPSPPSSASNRLGSGFKVILQLLQRAGATPTPNPTVVLISGANKFLETGEPGDPARGIHNGYASLSMPLMPDHDERKLSVREMINAYLFALLPMEQVLRRWADMAGAQQPQHQGR